MPLQNYLNFEECGRRQSLPRAWNLIHQADVTAAGKVTIHLKKSELIAIKFSIYQEKAPSLLWNILSGARAVKDQVMGSHPVLLTEMEEAQTEVYPIS